VAPSFEDPMTPIRQTQVKLSIAGIDVSASLAVCLVSFSHSDSIDDKSDSISITLHDSDYRFLRQWAVPKGTEIAASILQENVAGGGVLNLDCGIFFVDDLNFTLGRSGVTLELKANSVPTAGTAKGTKKYRAWEGADLKTITEQVAGDSGLGVRWEVQNDAKLSRTDQDGESDLQLLERLFDEAGHSMKITNKQIVVFNEEDYEARAPVFNITLGSAHYGTMSLKSSSVGKYKNAQVAWTSPRTGKTVLEEWGPAEPPEGVGAELKVYERYNRDGEDDEDEASDGGQARNYEWDVAEYDGGRKGKGKSRAKNEARNANKNEWQCGFSGPGNVRWNAGQTFTLSQEFGKFGRKYIVAEVTHNVSRGAGYTCEIKAHGTLNDY
jgi:uncharacterized protein